MKVQIVRDKGGNFIFVSFGKFKVPKKENFRITRYRDDNYVAWSISYLAEKALYYNEEVLTMMSKEKEFVWKYYLHNELKIPGIRNIKKLIQDINSLCDTGFEVLFTREDMEVITELDVDIKIDFNKLIKDGLSDSQILLTSTGTIKDHLIKAWIMLNYGN